MEYAVHGREYYAHLQGSRKDEGSSALGSWQLAAKGSWQQKQAKIECSRMSSAATLKGIWEHRVQGSTTAKRANSRQI